MRITWHPANDVQVADYSLPSHGSIHQNPTQPHTSWLRTCAPNFSSGGSLRISGIHLAWLGIISNWPCLAWSPHSWAGHTKPCILSAHLSSSITGLQPEALSCPQVMLFYLQRPRHVSTLNSYILFFVCPVLFALNFLSLLISLGNPHFEMIQLKCHDLHDAFFTHSLLSRADISFFCMNP